MLTLILNGCGGGGGTALNSDPSLPQTVGKVADGYINGAIVFWDCNSNNLLDANEVQTKSSAGGIFSIQAAPNTACVLVAKVPLGAIDEDAPTTPINAAYTLVSTKGNENFISPLSTLVAAHMAQNPTASLSDAQTAVASLLGISGNINSDYIAVQEGDHLVRRGVAKIAAAILQKNNLPASASSSLFDSYAEVQSQASNIKQVDFSSSTAISNFINPFKGFLRVSPYSVFSKYDTYYVRPNSKMNLTETQLQLLDSIIQTANLNDYIRNGVIKFNEATYADLQRIASDLRAASLIDNETNNTSVQALRAQRSLDQQKMNDYFTANMQGKVNFFSRDLATNFQFITSTAISGLEATSGAISFATGAPNIDLRSFKNRPKLKSSIKIIREYKLGEIAAALLKGVNSVDKKLSVENQAIIQRLINSDGSNLTQADYEAMLELADSIVDIAKDSFKSSNMKTFSKVFSFATALYSTTQVDCSDSLNFDCIYTGLEVLESVSEWAHFPTAIQGELQWMRSTMDAWTAGQEYANATSQEISLTQDVVVRNWDLASKNLLYSYLLQEVTVAGIDKLFEAYDPSIPCAANQTRSHGACRATASSVASISPTTATAGEVTTFTVAGTNLPTSQQLDITFNGCANIAVTLKSENLHKFTCTPQGAGTITIDIRATAGGTILKSQEVSVSSTNLSNYVLPSQFSTINAYLKNSNQTVSYPPASCQSSTIFTSNSCNECFDGGAFSAGEIITPIFNTIKNTTNGLIVFYKSEQEKPKFLPFNGSWLGNPVDWENNWDYNNSDLLFVAPNTQPNVFQYILGSQQMIRFYNTLPSFGYNYISSTVGAGNYISLLIFKNKYHVIDPSTGLESGLNTSNSCVAYKQK